MGYSCMKLFLAILFISLSLSWIHEAHAYSPPPNCASDGAHGLTYSTSTNAFFCTPITGSGSAPNVNAYSFYGNNTNATATGASVQYPTWGTPGFVPTNAVFGQLTNTTNGYLEFVLQNLSSGSSASTDFVVTANDGTDLIHYGDFGINGSAGGVAPFTNAHATYIYGADNEMDIGAIGSSGVVNIAVGATPTTEMSVSTSVITANENLNIATGALKIAGTTETFPASGLIVGTTDTQTLTNKTISGSSNTLSNIANASLTNSSMTIGGQSISLGGATTNQGNGSKLQLSTGTTTTNDCVKFDANGNTIDAGAACGSGGGTVTLGTSASATNPQRTSEAGTGEYSLHSGEWDLALTGNQAALISSSSTANMILGYEALASATTGEYNTGIGYKAGNAITTEQYSTAIGWEAYLGSGTRTGNTAIGAQTMTGVNGQVYDDNVAIGYLSMYGAQSTNGSVGIGYKTLYAQNGGYYNVAIGYQAMSSGNAGGGSNSGIGYQACLNVSGGQDSCIGYNAGSTMTSGSHNTVIGFDVGSTTLSTGSNNLLVGSSNVTDTAGANDSYEIAIGGAGLGSNTTEIGLSGTTTAATIYGNLSDSNGRVIDTAGTGMNFSGGTANSNAVWQASFQPGLLTAVTNTIGVFGKVSKASTVDNMIASTLLLSCVTNPTVSFYECGTSATCSSPTTIASVQVTATGTATPATISSASITAGDYIGWAISAGTCTSLDISATAQIHSN
jgi:trimeric autotransporter adhesin